MTTAALTAREQLLRDIRAELKEATEDVKGGTWDGRQVIPAEEAERILALPLAPASEHAAEVITPARIVAAATCPKCNLPAEISLQLGTELRVDSTGSTVRLVGKSKPASHVCGQTVIPFANGQAEAFEIGDIIGDADDDELEPAKS